MRELITFNSLNAKFEDWSSCWWSRHPTCLSQMEFPTLINWMNTLQVKGLLGCWFQFHSIFKSTLCKLTAKPDQKPPSGTSDLALYYLLMSHKKDTWLKWVNNKYLVKESKQNSSRSDLIWNYFVCTLFCLFDLILYVPSISFQLNRDESSLVEPVLS